MQAKTLIWLLLALCGVSLYSRFHPAAEVVLEGDRFRVVRGRQVLMESEQHPPGWMRQPDQDLTGDGRPECIIWGDYGGAYPVAMVYVLDLDSNEPVLVHQVLSHPRLRDLDGDGRSEFLVTDAEIGPPKEYPTYICRLEGRQLRVAIDLMKLLPPPDKAEMQRVIQANRQLQADHVGIFYGLGPASDLRRLANQLVYSGHADQALKLIQDARPELRSRQKFLEKYRLELSQSPIGASLEELNGPNFAWLGYPRALY